MEKRYNNKYKMVYGMELGSKLIELGFKAKDVQINRYDDSKLVYVFENTFELRRALNSLVRK